MASIVENNASNNPCQLIGRAVSKNHHTITEHDLSTFFGNVASAFGQESDGKTEAFDLMNLLNKNIDTNNKQQQELSTVVFEQWLNERFSDHPAHLEDLANVANEMYNEENIKEDIAEEIEVKEETISVTEEKQELQETNQILLDQIKKLQQEKAALHQKVQDVSNHHAKILKSALIAARIERTNTLRTGLSELVEKNKRLETQMIKRDAHIVRLKTALKTGSANQPPPVVSPSKSRNRTPTRRIISTLQNPTVEDTFTKPPSVIRRNLKKRARQTATTRTQNREVWEKVSLACIASILPSDDWNSISPEILYELALNEMQLLSQLSETSTRTSNASSTTNDEHEGNVKLLSKQSKQLEEQRATSCTYHANVARILLSSAIRRATNNNQRALKAKLLDKVSRICDFMFELNAGIEYAEKGGGEYSSDAVISNIAVITVEMQCISFIPLSLSAL